MSNASMRLKTAVVPPMPSINVRIAVADNMGRRRSSRPA